MTSFSGKKLLKTRKEVIKESERDRLSKELLFVSKPETVKSSTRKSSERPTLEETMPEEFTTPSTMDSICSSGYDWIYSSYSSVFAESGFSAMCGAKRRVKKIQSQPWPGEGTILMKDKPEKNTDSR